MATVLVNPTLVVGVGGTGCHVAKLLRKMIEMDVHIDDRDRIPMRFIGIDTDTRDANEIDDGEAPLHYVMEIAGRAEALGEESDRDPASPSFKRWLPRTKNARYVIDPAHLARGEGAGGKRLLGRYAFKYFAPDKFGAAQQHVEALRNLCNNPILEWHGVEYSAGGNIEVFVVCSLAGGTGSGAFLDVAAMCHRLCDEVAPGLPRSVHLVLVSPSAFQNSAHPYNQPTHKATAFACLKDLEHLLSQEEAVFEFHGERDVTVKGGLAQNVFLIGRHATRGTITELSEMFKVVAIQLYGMIGTPLGTAVDSVMNNNALMGQKDTAGGTRRYSSFGLVGIDYDLATRRYRMECACAAGVARRLRFGPSDAPLAPDQIEEEARSLVACYLGGPGASRVTELVGSYEDALSLPQAAEEEKPSEVVYRLSALATDANAARAERAIREDARLKWQGSRKEDVSGWKSAVETAAFDLVPRLGTEGACRVIAQSRELLAASKAELESRSIPASIASLADNAKIKLDKIGTFKRLLNPSSANEEKLDAISQYNEGARSVVREMAAKHLFENAFGADGIVACLSKVGEAARSADDLFKRTADVLDERSQEGIAPSTTALDWSRLVYDLVKEWPSLPPDAVKERVSESLRTWMEARAALDSVGKQILAAASEVQKGGAARAPFEKLAESLQRASSCVVADDVTEHILDMVMEGGEDHCRSILSKVMANLAPLALVDERTPGVKPYDATQALVPAKDGGVHPKQQAFGTLFEEQSKNSGFNQPSVVAYYGAPNRLLITRWIMGFALNDDRYTPLAELRRNYEVQRKISNFLEVDARWMDAPRPGQSIEGGRKLAWALGLAYGLIAQGKGHRYYNNLCTTQNRSPEVKGGPEEYEIDAERILDAVKSEGAAATWLPRVRQRPCRQTLGRRAIPLAFDSEASQGTGTWNRRDLIGTGRSEAMASFLQDGLEDYSDLETGLILVLNAYAESRGKGEVHSELERYVTALEAVKTPDERMQAQIECEISMIRLALESIGESGTFGLPEPALN